MIPPANPNDKTPLITHQQFIDQEKFTHSLRRASGQIGRGRGRGRGRGGFNNMGNRNRQQNNNYFDNSIEGSGNKNSGNNGSQGSNSDASTGNNNNNNSGHAVAGRGCERGTKSFFWEGDFITERDFSRSHKLLFRLYRAILSPSDMRSCTSLKEVQTLSQE